MRLLERINAIVLLAFWACIPLAFVTPVVMMIIFMTPVGVLLPLALVLALVFLIIGFLREGIRTHLQTHRFSASVHIASLLVLVPLLAYLISM